MARYKVSVLLISAFLLFTFSTALDFNVKVAPTPEANIYQPSLNSNGSYFNASMSVENEGSLGCEFRIKGDIQQGGQSINRYSTVYEVWPGDLVDSEFIYIPLNYTGQVEANLSLQYCEQQKHIESYTFNSTEKILPNNSVESKTLEVDSREALIHVNQEEGVLVPQQHPPRWKVGSAKISDHQASIEYDPTLFREGKEIVYTVVENSKVKAETTVVLEDEETWYEEILRTVRERF